MLSMNLIPDDLIASCRREAGRRWITTLSFLVIIKLDGRFLEYSNPQKQESTKASPMSRHDSDHKSVPSFHKLQQNKDSILSDLLSTEGSTSQESSHISSNSVSSITTRNLTRNKEIIKR